VYLDQMQGHPGQQPQQLEPTPAQPSGEPSAVRQDLDQTGQSAPAQPLQQNAAPASTAPSVQGDAGAEVSENPSGPSAQSQSVGDPAAPREINNNPAPATYGATEN
jgi:hypothetical protein